MLASKMEGGLAIQWQQKLGPCNSEYFSDLLMLNTVKGIPDKRCLEMSASLSAYRQRIQEDKGLPPMVSVKLWLQQQYGRKASSLPHISFIQNGSCGGWLVAALSWFPWNPDGP